MLTRTILSVTNLHWVNEDNTVLEADVVFQELGPDPVPFSCGPESVLVYDHEFEFWTKSNQGDYGPIAPYVAP